MPRSVGITVSAVVVIVGSAFTIFGGAMMLLGSLLLSKSGLAANAPANLASFAIVEAVVIFGFGGWGLAAGIGLINLKRWSRISMLVFAAMLVFVSLPAAAILAIIPLPNTSDPNVPSNFMPVMRITIVLFYAAFGALGGFWLYFFNKRTVKAQFQAEQPPASSAAPHLPLGTPIAASSAGRRARPLSITIIGSFLLIGSALTPLSLLYSSALFRGVQFPLFFLGFYFGGRAAYIILTVWMAAQVVAAVGLLKLKNWGLFATIGLQCLTAVNAALLVGIPGNRARFQQIMDTMIASMEPRMPRPVPFTVPIWIGFAVSLPIVFVILWFLITRRRFFAPPAQELDRQRE